MIVNQFESKSHCFQQKDTNAHQSNIKHAESIKVDDKTLCLNRQATKNTEEMPKNKITYIELKQNH